MKSVDGTIIFIDFSFAGQINSNVPEMILRWVYNGTVFDVDADLTANTRLFEVEK
jgi:hypothetical protein